MDERHLQAYRKRLLTAGLAPRKVARHLREVADHYEDLHVQALASGADVQGATCDCRRRMGPLNELATAMITSTPRSLLHRYPLLLATALPVMLYVLLNMLFVFALVCMFEAVEKQPGVAHADALEWWFAALANMFSILQAHLLTPLLAIVLIDRAIRQHLRLRYWVSGAILLLLLGSFSNMGISLPDPASGNAGELYLSIGRPGQTSIELIGNDHLLRLLVNVLLCACWTWFCAAQEARLGRAAT